MRRLALGLLLALLLLAPGCRVFAAAGLVAGSTFVGDAVDRWAEEPPCDRHAVTPPMGPCR